jgi:hypothetical protein
MRPVFDTLGVAGEGYELNTGKPIFLRRMGFCVIGIRLMALTSALGILCHQRLSESQSNLVF